MRLWGLLGREVSLDEEELCLLSLRAVGPQPSDPLALVLGPLASLCPVPVALPVRRHCKAARTCDKGMDEMRAL